MTPEPSQSGIIPLTRAIDHYFELALYLLVLTGFATLASTGGLDLPSIILVGAALAVRGYLLAKRWQFVISERWTTPLSILYFVFFLSCLISVFRCFCFLPPLLPAIAFFLSPPPPRALSSPPPVGFSLPRF